VVFLYIFLTALFILFYLFYPIQSTTLFYVACFLLGVGVGYWALFVTIAAEQFGTNLRSTVATTVPNFIRGTVVPITLLFGFLRDDLQLGVITGAVCVGAFTIIIGLIALRSVEETFGRDLNFLEQD
jgi:hypothetical protein